MYTLKENSPAKGAKGGKEGKKEDIGGNGAKRTKVREGRKRFMAARINFFFEEEWTGRIYRPVFWEEQRENPLPPSQLDITVWEKVGGRGAVRGEAQRLKFNVVAVPRYRSLLRLLSGLNCSVVIENRSKRWSLGIKWTKLRSINRFDNARACILGISLTNLIAFLLF